MDPLEKARQVAAEVERQAAQLAPEDDPKRPKKHHLVSQTLLARFFEPGGEKLASYTLRSTAGAVPSRASAVGYVRNFVAYQPSKSEHLWHLIEEQLPGTLAALDSEKPLSAQQERILRCCIALHWARRLATAEIHNHAFKTAIDDSTDPERLRLLASLMYGEHVEDNERLQIVRDEVFGHWSHCILPARSSKPRSPASSSLPATHCSSAPSKSIEQQTIKSCSSAIIR